MFLIASGREPESLEDLHGVLAETLAETFGVANAAECIGVTGPWPRLEQVSVDLTGGRIDPLHPPSVPNRVEAGQGKSVLSCQRLELKADPLFLGASGRLELHVEASGAELSFVRDDRQRLWLLPHHFSSGAARIGMNGRDLEHLFLEGARQAAAEHGVTIEESRLRLEQSDAKQLRIEAELLARKLFVKSRIMLQGRISFDEQLNIHFSEMSCTGKGVVATVACKFLEPHLEVFEQQPLPLLSLVFPSVRLRHAQLTTDSSGRLEATAELGEEREA